MEYGRNAVDQSKPPSTLALMCRSLFEPFNVLMLVVAILTAVPPNSSYPTFALIMVSHCLLYVAQDGLSILCSSLLQQVGTMHWVHLIKALPVGDRATWNTAQVYQFDVFVPSAERLPYVWQIYSIWDGQLTEYLSAVRRYC